MAVPFMKFTTRKRAVLTSKIDKLFIVIGIIRKDFKILLKVPLEYFYEEKFYR